MLETCMKNCGSRFHSEVAKFKFLNELVKVISPKVSDTSRVSIDLLLQPAAVLRGFSSSVFQYMGDTLSEKVKAKVSAMLYSWTVSLPDQPKICQAYQMLKAQGESDADEFLTMKFAKIPLKKTKIKKILRCSRGFIS